MSRRAVPASLLAMVLAGAGLAWLARPAPPMADRMPPAAAPAAGTGAESAAEPLRIVAFGTSLTAGYDWPDVLADRLRVCLARDVAMTRIARPGAGSDWALAQVGRVARARPDIVLVEFATNDADLIDGVSPRRAEARHDRLLASLRAEAPQARIVLMTMNPVAGAHRLIRLRLGRHNSAYARLAARHNAGFVNLIPRWKTAPASLRRPLDGLHPRGDAATAIIVPPLAGMLAQAKGGYCQDVASPPRRDG